MNIYPAIDLYDNKAVRLYKGDYNQMTVYSDDPVSVACEMEKKGAKFIHLVDLEGAKFGTTPNIEVVKRIVASTDLFVEIGGGIRDMETLNAYFNVGVSRVIIGTSAVLDDNFLCKAIEVYGERIAVGADVKDGYIAIKGWTQKSSLTLDAFFIKMQELGVHTIICTDISKDGAMNGTNLQMYKSLSERYSVDIIASGGVSSIEDIKVLSNYNISGAIIGKAYYIGAIDLSEAIEVSK